MLAALPPIAYRPEWSVTQRPEPILTRITVAPIRSLLLTMVAAGILSSRSGWSRSGSLRSGRFIGVPVTGAVVPVMGWSRDVSDLRFVHFRATRALPVVPLLELVVVAVRSLLLARAVVWAGQCQTWLSVK